MFLNFFGFQIWNYNIEYIFKKLQMSSLSCLKKISRRYKICVWRRTRGFPRTRAFWLNTTQTAKKCFWHLKWFCHCPSKSVPPWPHSYELELIPASVCAGCLCLPFSFILTKVWTVPGFFLSTTSYNIEYYRWFLSHNGVHSQNSHGVENILRSTNFVLLPRLSP